MSAVAELFGNPVTSMLAGWRSIVAEQHCPYINSRCYKVRKSAPDVSMAPAPLTTGGAMSSWSSARRGCWTAGKSSLTAFSC